MTGLLTAKQMRGLETAAMASGMVAGLELMERAGCGVVASLLDHWPELGQAPRRALVLCGPGNNGGDGFVVARLLQARGWEVDLLLHGDAERLPPDARANFERWFEIGPVRPLCAPTGGLDSLDETMPDLIVDALFGTGLTRPLGGEVARALAGLEAWIDRQPVRPALVAVDLPSGLCSDSGRALGRPLACDLTVAFHRAKLGHVLAEGPELCGRLSIVDIGLEQDDTGVPQLSGSAGLAKGGGHKFDHGHALILSGSAGRTGAARLAARGALRIGAGLVTLAVPPAAQLEVASQTTALMLARVADAAALQALLKDERLNAMCLGPGLGLERARVLVPAALEAGRATVLDADALSTFQGAPEELFALLHDRCVLTPHAGEFGRLFPDIAARLSEPDTKGPAYSKLDATRDAAMRAGCVVLFKGPDTVIADATGRAVINASVYDRAAPWLATAGAGDVLAGFICGLLARGFDPMQAAAAGAWLHTECARSFGPGLIAEDLPEELPKVLRKQGL